MVHKRLKEMKTQVINIFEMICKLSLTSSYVHILNELEEKMSLYLNHLMYSNNDFIDGVIYRHLFIQKKPFCL